MVILLECFTGFPFHPVEAFTATGHLKRQEL